jgi:hypothetical protein
MTLVKIWSPLAALAGAALAGVLLEAVPASAQESVPSYARPDESVHGVVQKANGYDLEVRDDRGFIDRIKLHDGTVINPTGLKLAPGQTVTVHGQTNGSVFEASEIDTRYHYTYAYAYPAPYYPYYYGYPYPVYGPPVFGFGLGIHIR